MTLTERIQALANDLRKLDEDGLGDVIRSTPEAIELLRRIDQYDERNARKAWEAGAYSGISDACAIIEDMLDGTREIKSEHQYEHPALQRLAQRASEIYDQQNAHDLPSDDN